MKLPSLMVRNLGVMRIPGASESIDTDPSQLRVNMSVCATGNRRSIS